MSQPRSKAARPKRRHSAEVIDCEVVETLRDYRLARRALDGDVGPMVEWLQAFGGREWQLPASMQPDKWQHDPGRGTGLPARGSTAQRDPPTRVNG
jgi:hypothetical protein